MRRAPRHPSQGERSTWNESLKSIGELGGLFSTKWRKTAVTGPMRF